VGRERRDLDAVVDDHDPVVAVIDGPERLAEVEPEDEGEQVARGDEELAGGVAQVPLELRPSVGRVRPDDDRGDAACRAVT
jgi:hypothetical protein